MMHRLLSIIGLLMWACPMARAQAPLTWDECVAAALAHNPDLISARNALESGRLNYYGSFNGLMPQLTLSNSYSNFNGPGNNASWQAAGSASVNLFNMSQVASIKSASANYSQAEASLRQVSAALRANLRTAFARLLYAQQNIVVAKLIKEIRDKDAQMLVLRYESGSESKGNKLRALAQQIQAQAAFTAAQRDLLTAQEALDRQLGHDDFETVVVTGTLAAVAPADFAAIAPSLIAQRPDIAVQEAVVKSAQAAVSAARSPLWPSLSASYGRSRSGVAEFPSDHYGWNVGGTLSYALFGGGPTSVYYGVSAASKNLLKAQQDLRIVRDQAMVDLHTTWSAFASAIDQVNVEMALLAAARQRNDEADIQYASGLLSFDNWEIIVSDRISTEIQALQAQLTAVTAQAAWEQSLGKGLE